MKFRDLSADFRTAWWALHPCETGHAADKAISTPVWRQAQLSPAQAVLFRLWHSAEVVPRRWFSRRWS
jgi:hypothetical protein